MIGFFFFFVASSGGKGSRSVIVPVPNCPSELLSRFDQLSLTQSWVSFSPFLPRPHLHSLLLPSPQTLIREVSRSSVDRQMSARVSSRMVIA